MRVRHSPGSMSSRAHQAGAAAGDAETWQRLVEASIASADERTRTRSAEIVREEAGRAAWTLAASILASGLAFATLRAQRRASGDPHQLRRGRRAGPVGVNASAAAVGCSSWEARWATTTAKARWNRHALFAAASLLCALAPSLPLLLAARAMQGVGAALLLPNSLALLNAAFEGEKRGRAVGLWAAAGAATAAVAPLLGGWLVGTVGWPAIFYINLPLALAAIVLALLYVAESRNLAAGRTDYAGALLATNIKFNGALIMQVYGDGPLQLLVVECQSDLSLRATAKVRDEPIADDIELQDLLNRGGGGRFAITLDPTDPMPGQQPYQGIVPLEGSSVAEVLQTYMRQSEQLETRLWLASGSQSASGLLLQRLPDSGGMMVEASDEDVWSRLIALASTVRSDELLGLAPDHLLERLFWQESLVHHTRLTPRFACTCSRERIAKMLISLGQDPRFRLNGESGRGPRRVRASRTGRSGGRDVAAD